LIVIARLLERGAKHGEDKDEPNKSFWFSWGKGVVQEEAQIVMSWAQVEHKRGNPRRFASPVSIAKFPLSADRGG
jgi:hypothetical protein